MDTFEWMTCCCTAGGFAPAAQIRVANTVNKETIPAELDGMEINDMSLTYSVAVSALVAVRARVRGSVCTQSMMQGRRGFPPTLAPPNPSRPLVCKHVSCNRLGLRLIFRDSLFGLKPRARSHARSLTLVGGNAPPPHPLLHLSSYYSPCQPEPDTAEHLPGPGATDFKVLQLVKDPSTTGGGPEDVGASGGPPDADRPPALAGHGAETAAGCVGLVSMPDQGPDGVLPVGRGFSRT